MYAGEKVRKCDSYSVVTLTDWYIYGMLVLSKGEASMDSILFRLWKYFDAVQPLLKRVVCCNGIDQNRSPPWFLSSKSIQYIDPQFFCYFYVSLENIRKFLRGKEIKLNEVIDSKFISCYSWKKARSICLRNVANLQIFVSQKVQELFEQNFNHITTTYNTPNCFKWQDSFHHLY